MAPALGWPKRRGKVTTMKEMTVKFLREEQGLETVEYAVMTAVIVAAVVAAIGAIAAAIQGRFTTVKNAIPQ